PEQMKPEMVAAAPLRTVPETNPRLWCIVAPLVTGDHTIVAGQPILRLRTFRSGRAETRDQDAPAGARADPRRRGAHRPTLADASQVQARAGARSGQRWI